MKEFVNRLLTEKQELDERKKKLFDFMTTTEYQDLSANEKFLLGVQYNAMCIYSIVLFKRINLYKTVNKCKGKCKKYESKNSRDSKSQEI